MYKSPHTTFCHRMSCTGNATNPLYKINDYKTTPQDVIVVLMEVQSPYSDIKHKAEVFALGELCNKRISNPFKEVITAQMQHLINIE